MSDRPCTACRSTTNGRLFFVYVNHYASAEDVEQRRARLCKDCVIDLVVPLIENADHREGNSWTPHEQLVSTES
jgi:hypothetical protein